MRLIFDSCFRETRRQQRCGWAGVETWRYDAEYCFRAAHPDDRCWMWQDKRESRITISPLAASRCLIVLLRFKRFTCVYSVSSSGFPFHHARSPPSTEPSQLGKEQSIRALCSDVSGYATTYFRRHWL